MVKAYKCCEGYTIDGLEGQVKEYPAIKAKVTSNAPNMYDYVLNVKLGGRDVRMHLLLEDRK